jgi:hypothetical protein
MSDELYYTPSTLEERVARARARRAEEERAIVAMEAKELEVAAEAEKLRTKTPTEVMTKMLTAVQASLVERLERMERSVIALTSRVTALESIDNGVVTIAGLPYSVPIKVLSINVIPEGQYPRGSFCDGTYHADCNPWSLEGFQRFKKCKTLHLTGCDIITDFTPLGGMTALEHLTISGVCQSGGYWTKKPKVSDIRWISSLVNLRQVSFIACNLLTDITPLATLRNLQEVTLRETGVHSTECIARLKVNIS